MKQTYILTGWILVLQFAPHVVLENCQSTVTLTVHLIAKGLVLCMSDLSDLRPKLKQDSVFLQIEDGMFLKNGEVVFSIKGKHIYRLMSRLLPYMTGEYTLGMICDGLEAGQRVSIEKL